MRGGGSRGRVLPALGLGSDSGKPQEVGEDICASWCWENSLTDEVCTQASSPRPLPCPPKKGHAALFDFELPCWLPGAVGRSPTSGLQFPLEVAQGIPFNLVSLW